MLSVAREVAGCRRRTSFSAARRASARRADELRGSILIRAAAGAAARSDAADAGIAGERAQYRTLFAAIRCRCWSISPASQHHRRQPRLSRQLRLWPARSGSDDRRLPLCGHGRIGLPGIPRPHARAGLAARGEWQLHGRTGALSTPADFAGRVPRGQPARLVLAIDVTARKAAERALKVRNNWLKSVLDHFPGGVSVADGDLRIVRWNEQFRRLLDFPAELFDGEPRPARFRAFQCRTRVNMANATTSRLSSPAAARINRHEPHHFERAPRRHGARSARHALPDGGFVSSYTDITARKNAEAEILAEREALPRPVRAFAGSLLADRRRVFNGATRPRSRFSAMAAGRNCWRRTRQAVAGESSPMGARLREGRSHDADRLRTQRAPFQWEHQRRDGSCFPVEVTLARLDMPGQDLLYCVWRDITDPQGGGGRTAVGEPALRDLNAELEARVEERAASPPRSKSAGWRSGGTPVISLAERDHRYAPVGVSALGQSRGGWRRGIQPFCRLYPASVDLLHAGMDRKRCATGCWRAASFRYSESVENDWDRLGPVGPVLPGGHVSASRRLPTSDGGRLVLQSDVTALRRTARFSPATTHGLARQSRCRHRARDQHADRHARMVASALGDGVAEFNLALENGSLRRSTLEKVRRHGARFRKPCWSATSFAPQI